MCPGGGPPPTPAYDACLHEEMWTRHPILLDALAGLQAPGGTVTAILVGVVPADASCCFRRELADQYAPRPVAPPGSCAR